jgi:hypothetical protein
MVKILRIKSLTSARAGTRGRAHIVLYAPTGTEASALLACGNNLKRLKGGLLLTHDIVICCRGCVEARLIRAQNTSAPAKGEVGGIVYGSRHFY